MDYLGGCDSKALPWVIATAVGVAALIVLFYAMWAVKSSAEEFDYRKYEAMSMEDKAKQYLTWAKSEGFGLKSLNPWAKMEGFGLKSLNPWSKSEGYDIRKAEKMGAYPRSMEGFDYRKYEEMSPPLTFDFMRGRGTAEGATGTKVGYVKDIGPGDLQSMLY